MTIATTVAAFQTLHASVTGVTSAPTAMPQSLTTDMLPLAFTWPGPTVEGGGWKPGAGGWYEQRRYYIVRCFVKPLAQGAGFDDGYQTALALLQRFGAAYMASANRNLSGAVAHIGPRIEDNGVRGDYQWVTGGDVWYHGFELRIEVSEKV